MTSSPDLLAQLRAARPSAPVSLRGRVRELAAAEPGPALRSRLRFPVRRSVLVAIPAAATLALVSAAVVGLVRSDLGSDSTRPDALAQETTTGMPPPVAGTSPPRAGATTGGGPSDSTIGPTTGRAQRVSATLTVEVADRDAVSRSAQDALDLTRALGGHVVSASVATGDEGTASLTVRIPVDKVQEAIVRLSALGRIVSQQVTIDDLQESLDRLERRQRSLRAQIAGIVASLESDTVDGTTRARLEARLKNLRAELRAVRGESSQTTAEARMSTIQLTIATPGALGAVAPPPSRIDRSIDEALDVLAWEGIVVLGLLIAIAPFAIVGAALWLGRHLYRRREEERLLAAS